MIVPRDVERCLDQAIAQRFGAAAARHCVDAKHRLNARNVFPFNHARALPRLETREVFSRLAHFVLGRTLGRFQHIRERCPRYAFPRR